MELSLLRNGSANTPVARQWLSGRHVTAATDTNATLEELLEAVFSVRFVRTSCHYESSRERESADKQLRVGIWRVEKPVAEAGDSSETQRKGNVHR
jgi:hypothetical protein